ncbi:hypothetical protein GOP47_0026348 [Adiantum capillus-veneris]|nr:hypothetical protein GOP47_0026348 [Adiantum capillus-veneris]
MAGSEEKESVENTPAEEGDDPRPAAEEEDTGAEVAPIIKLDAISVSTGEENEDVLIDLKAKLYRFDKDGNQWKERGMGQVKLLQHKETKKVRLVMRQNKTLKICANHTVVPSISLQEHQGSDKTWVWHASDFAEGELKDELFCIRFGSVENAQAFKKAFEAAQKEMSGTEGEDDEDAKEVGELLEGLKVGDKEAKSEDVKEEVKESTPSEKKDVASTEEK